MGKREKPPSSDGPGKAALDSARGQVACSDELRCLCGSLLARVRRDSLELKCRRCKRAVHVQLRDGRFEVSEK